MLPNFPGAAVGLKPPKQEGTQANFLKIPAENLQKQGVMLQNFQKTLGMYVCMHVCMYVFM